MRRILAAEDVARAGCAAFESRTVSLRHIVHVRIGPEVLRSDQSGKASLQVIRDQPADEVAFRQQAGAVDHTGIYPDQRRAGGDGVGGDAIGSDLRSLVVVGLERRRLVARRQGKKRGRVDDASEAAARGGVEDVLQAADIDVVEILRPRPPDADQRRRVQRRVAAGGGARDRVAVADVAVGEAARQTAPRGRAREDDRIVSARRKRADDRLSQVTGAAGDQHLHRSR